MRMHLCGRKVLQSNFRRYHALCLGHQDIQPQCRDLTQDLKIAKKSIVTSLGRELNVGQPKYEAGMPITRWRHPVILREVRGKIVVNQRFVKIRRNRAVLEIEETWQGIAERTESKCRSISLMVHSKTRKV
jgi:hypothetical protein